MAEVYRASLIEGRGFERPVCLKMMRSEFADDAEFAAMFEREARIAMALRHPNIVQVFDFERCEGRSFLVMEYVEGLDLREILRMSRELGLRVPVGFALHVVEGLLRALSHAHGHEVQGELRPIVHRDVSPHNLLVSTSGHVKLADFGIAKARDSSNATRTGIVKGKLAYLSPEQAAGGEVGTASDLFCVGLVLYEALAGRRLYSGKNEQEVLAQALRPRFEELPSLSLALNRFLSSLLAEKPAERCADARTALDEIGRLRREEPYEGADASSLVKSLLAVKREREASAQLDIHDEPTRTSHSDIPLAMSRAGRVGGLRPALAAAVAVGVLCAGIGLGWFLNPALRAQKTEAVGVAVKAPTPQKIESPVLTLAAPASEKSEDLEDRNAEGKEAPSAIAPARAEGPGKQASPVKDAKGIGFLQVNCRPWADISVDGKRVGTTPITKLKVASGQHKIVLANAALVYREVVTVEVAPGEIARINRTVPGSDATRGEKQ